MVEDRQRAFRKLVLAAASSPVNLGLLGIGTVSGMVLHSLGGPSASGWGTLLVGLAVLAYLALMVMDLTSKRFAEKALCGTTHRYRVQEDHERPSLSEIHGSALRSVYATILSNLERVQDTFERGSEDTRQLLATSLAHCEMLAGEAGRAAMKGNALAAYLAAEAPVAIKGEIAQLERDADAATDAQAKDGYRKAAESKRQQLETYEQIHGLYDRIRAQLSVIETALDTVNAKLVKLSATDIQEVMVTNESIASHLQSMTDDIHILESTVEETIQELSL